MPHCGKIKKSKMEGQEGGDSMGESVCCANLMSRGGMPGTHVKIGLGNMSVHL